MGYYTYIVKFKNDYVLMAIFNGISRCLQEILSEIVIFIGMISSMESRYL
ncbi:hypothetical protein KPL40_12265 [Clostridium gasigenes]|nr:hypothetical protein [Clostridium gasigenes]MBU3133224.1 hypothetical protein [Clostridium gasigenes]